MSIEHPPDTRETSTDTTPDSHQNQPHPPDVSTCPVTVAHAPRQFDPTGLIRLRNLIDDDNAY